MTQRSTFDKAPSPFGRAVAALGLLPLFASIFLPTVAQAQKTAYVMIGLSDIPSDYRSTALAAAERYKNAGYKVVFLGRRHKESVSNCGRRS